jgi:Spy/CpxP family protein refolding chaperone
MKPLKPVVGIILVFLLGAVSGSLVTYLVSQARMETFIKGGPAVREEHLVKRLTTELDLDTQQHAQVEAIIHETHESVRQIRRTSRPQIDVLIQGSQMRISALLRPEQQIKFKKVIEEHKARRQAEER